MSVRDRLLVALGAVLVSALLMLSVQDARAQETTTTVEPTTTTSSTTTSTSTTSTTAPPDLVTAAQFSEGVDSLAGLALVLGFFVSVGVGARLVSP